MINSTNQCENPQRKHRDSAGNRRGATVKKVLNLRLLAGTLLALVVLAPAGYFWRGYQVRSTAGVFVERAEKLQEEGDLRKAAGYLHRYLQICPEDIMVQARLAHVYAEGVLTRQPMSIDRAIELCYRAIGSLSAEDSGHGGENKAAEIVSLRKDLAELLIASGKFRSAEIEADHLLAYNKEEADGLSLKAIAVHRQFLSGSLAGQNRADTEVGSTLYQAWVANKGNPLLAKRLADIFRGQPELLSLNELNIAQAKAQELLGLKKEEKEGKAEETIPPQQAWEAMADWIMDEMVGVDAQNAEAFLHRYRYRLQYKLAGADEDLQAAMKHGMENPNVLLSAARESWQDMTGAIQDKKPAKEILSHIAKAREYYQGIIDIAGAASEEAYLYVGESYYREGKTDRAIQTWKDALEKREKLGNTRLNARLAEVFLTLGKLKDAEGHIAKREQIAQQLDRAGDRSALALQDENKLLRARLLIQKGSLEEALGLLKRLSEFGSGTQLEPFRVRSLLGSVYSLLGQPAAAAEAYEGAMRGRPEQLPIKVAAAEVWKAAGNPARAVALYEEVAKKIDNATIWLSLAEVRLMQQLRPNNDGAGRDKPDWKSVSEPLKKAEEALAEKKNSLQRPWRLDLLKSSLAQARATSQGLPEEGVRQALECLREAQKKYPDALLLTSLVSRYQRLGSPDDADRALGQLCKLKGESTQTYLLQTNLQIHRGNIEEAEKSLRSGLAKLPKESHGPLQLALARLDFHQGRRDQARGKFIALLQQYPKLAPAASYLALMDLESGNFQDLKKWEEKLFELQGSSSPVGLYCRAGRLLLAAENARDPRFLEAESLQRQIADVRPNWPRGHSLRGMVLERQGDTEAAMVSYAKAIALGDQRIAVYKRLIELLYRLGRFDDASRCMTELRARTPSSTDLTNLEINIAMAKGETEQALEIARREVKDRKNDAIARIWLGTMLAQANKLVEAETELNKAVTLAPTDAGPRMALFDFYRRTKKPGQARETLKKMASNASLTDARCAAILAHAHFLLGDIEQSKADYEKAARLAPDDPGLHLRWAALLEGEDPGGAEAILRKFLAANSTSPGSAPVLRRLVVMLAGQGTAKAWEEAEKLLQEMGSGDKISSTDRRLRAFLLARRGGVENLTKAKRLIEEVIDESATADGKDSMMLAQILELEGKPRLAELKLADLVGRPNPQKTHLQAYAAFLIRHYTRSSTADGTSTGGDTKAEMDRELIDKQLEKLAQISADDLDVAAMKVQWLKASGRADQIESYLEPIAKRLSAKFEKDKDEPRKAALSAAIGGIYMGVDQYVAALSWVEILQPKRFDLKAICLAKQGEMKEAVGLCLKAADSDGTILPALVLATALVSGSPSESDFRLGEPLLHKALKSHGNSAELLMQLANVRIRQKRYDDATQLYRRILKEQPHNTLVLNNLATVLAEQPQKRAEAIQIIDKAIKDLGPKGTLLDTKGWILVLEDKPAEGVKLLAEAATGPAGDPRFDFHLAVAYDRLDDPEKAKTAFDKAINGGLEEQLLMETDTKELKQLKDKLSKQSWDKSQAELNTK